jgi:hypothetical protein
MAGIGASEPPARSWGMAEIGWRNCRSPRRAQTTGRAERKPSSNQPAAPGALLQGLEKPLCRPQIGRVETFGKAIVDRLKQRKRLNAPVLTIP